MESINDRFSKKTKYDLVKETKRNNYKYLNEEFQYENGTVLVGDSITELYNPEFFFDFTKETGQAVYNRGISGDTSDRMYERLIDNVINLKPKNIVMLIGTNDFGLGAPVEFTFCNIEQSVNLIKEMLPDTNIILQAVYPVNRSVLLLSSPVGKRDNEVIKELNTRLERFCEAQEITFVDLTEALSDKKERLSKEYTYDGLHLNAEGYKVVTDKILPLLLK